MPKKRTLILKTGNVLNRYPGAAAAYSTRLLNSRYAGPALRVRRAADNVEVDVPFGANAALGTTDMERFLRSYTGGFGTNLLLYSEEFNNSAWLTDNTSVVDQNFAASPIGTQTAERLSANVTNSYLRMPVSVIAGSTYTFSVWIKQVTSTNSFNILFTNSSGSIVYASQEVTTTENWQRVSVTATIPVSNPQVLIGGANSFSSGESVLIWGAQLELGSTVTTYDYKRDTANTSAFVTTWYDQSGNARNATQTTAANQPRIVNAGVVDKVNGRVSAYGAGTNGVKLLTGAFTVNQPDWMFTVQLSQNAANDRYVTDGTGAGRQIVGQAAINRIIFAGTVLSDGAQVANQMYQQTSLFNSTASQIYVNSVLATTGNAGTNALSGGLNLFNSTDGGAPWTGYIPEVILYPSDQSTNRAAIESNIILHYFGPERLLNQYANAAAAYSTRQLDRFYTGPALRVRRSNDNAETDIGFDANGNLNEAALTAFVGTNSAFVTTWYDQSGNARNATQTTAANQPRIVNAGVVDKVNGRVSSVFGVTTLTALNVVMSLPQPNTAFAVARYTNTIPVGGIAGPKIFDEPVAGANRTIMEMSGPTGNLRAHAGTTLEDGLIQQNVLFQATAIYNGANSLVQKSGSVAVTGNTGTANLINPRIGNSDKEWIGEIPELIIYNSNQSANRAAIESNIMSYFGITA